MLKIGIITGSTRPNRKSLDIAKWVLEAARKRSDAEYELVDIKDFELPLLDEPTPPSMGKYEQPHTKRWAAKIASLDAFVFVSPGVQPRHSWSVEERDRLSLRGMESQSGGIRELRGCGRCE